MENWRTASTTALGNLPRRAPARDHDLGGVLRRRQRRQPQQLRFVGAGVRSRQCRRAQRAIPGDRAADFQAEAVAMTGVRPLLRRLRRSERGTAFVEFALPAPVFLLILLGIFVYFWQLFSQQVLPAVAPQAGHGAHL